MASQQHKYGADPSQFGELTGAGPVAVLIHGGFWRDRYDLRLMDPLAADLAARGWAAWNIEYRRLGSGGGVPETLDDVAAAIDHLGELEGVDLSRVVAIGHSAGGHLAAWAATRGRAGGPGGGSPAVGLRVSLTAVVSQAGVLDVRRAWELGLSDDVAREFLRGDIENAKLASPIERLPLGVPALLTHGGRDDIVPLEISQRFAERSGATLIVEPDEDHFGHLDPANPLWQAVVKWI